MIPQRTWQKSSHSDDGNCVEVAYTHELVFVRDSKNGAGPVLRFGPNRWQAFIKGVRLGGLNPRPLRTDRGTGAFSVTPPGWSRPGWLRRLSSRRHPGLP
ncbi:DUF397 domain-containing protein [Micromonospora echinospora]|uniref:DUF397 domain-containing protein n=1 Tax=Micromonospora echinospora TaxID=1877 RepID=UPI003A891CED